MSLSEKSVAAVRRPVKEKRQVAYIARAKVGNGWITLGAAWELRSGEGYSIKLNALPVGNDWNGQMVLIPPLQMGDMPED